MEEMDSRTQYFDYDGHRRFGDYPGEQNMNSLKEQCFIRFFKFKIHSVFLKSLLCLCVIQENASNDMVSAGI